MKRSSHGFETMGTFWVFVDYFTVILQVAVLPLNVLTVIVAVPAFFAVTLPSLTVATALLLVVHVFTPDAVPSGRVAFKV